MTFGRCWVAGLLIAGGGWGCGAEDGVTDPCGETLLAGAVIDETALGFLDAESRAVEDAQRSPELTEPAADVPLSRTTPPSFVWSSTLAQLEARSPAGGRFAAAPVRTLRPGRSPSVWSRLSEWLVPSAHAHGTPFTGDAYLLRVTGAEGKCFTALTSELSFTPPATAWEKLEGETIEVSLTSAVLRDDRVTEGPFRGPRRSHPLQ